MSLTSFIKQTEVREKFQEQFPKPRFHTKKELLFPPLTKNYTEAGMAFDYLFRFGLKRNNLKAVERRWVAELAFRDMPGFTLDLVTGKSYFEPDWEISIYEHTGHKPLMKRKYRISERANEIVLQAKKEYARFLNSGRLTKRLIKSTVFLARLDGKLRGGVPAEKLDLDNVDEKDITDLRNLIKAVNWDDFKARKICLLNPTFGEASRLVGGADADVVIDDTLIEIKTTKKWELKRDYFNQLIGYCCLYCIGGIDGLPKNRKIKRFGIYFSRYAHLHMLPIGELIDQQRFAKFLRWFKAKLQNYTKT